MHPAARAALALPAVLLALGGCGGGDAAGQSVGPLEWVKQPLVFKHPTLADDRVLTGELRNDSRRRIDLAAADLRLVDANGERVGGPGVFLNTFGHGIYPPQRGPVGGVPSFDRRRTGQTAVIAPGDKVPYTVAWRAGKGDRLPVRIAYGTGSSLPIPEPK